MRFMLYLFAILCVIGSITTGYSITVGDPFDYPYQGYLGLAITVVFATFPAICMYVAQSLRCK